MLTRDELSTITTALFCHERTCDLRADALYNERSSDKTYEQNAYLSGQARHYREFAGNMRKVRERVNALLADMAG